MATMHDQFKMARDIVGGIPQLAELLGVTPANLYHLFKLERPCPPNLVLDVEAATGISREMLRHDLYPAARNCVYGLRLPGEQELFYIGKTINFNMRMRGHALSVIARSTVPGRFIADNGFEFEAGVIEADCS